MRNNWYSKSKDRAWITGPYLMWMVVNVGLDSFGQLIYFIWVFFFVVCLCFFSLKHSLVHFIQRITPTSQSDSVLPCQEVLLFSCRSLADMNLGVNNYNVSGIQVVWARIPKRSLCIGLAALPLQCQGTESSALVDSKGNWIYRTGEGKAAVYFYLY